ncbi:hypothetical protein MPSI1_003271 [Malassezia psittaci]|uniref:CREG-like beta-barrel domain-containing protein n=1 Tax=Malassezia psittaci TaxID=1821823 RepID=A0AAF0FHF1_9BASI|nr:hypothetical protein MPSI1_003271 [Malassezia psittaci]
MWGPIASLLVLCSTVVAWESSEQAAIDLRKLLQDDTTFFVASLGSVGKLGNVEIGAEYYAPCFNASTSRMLTNASDGDLLFLALPVSSNWRNVLAPNASASVLIHSNSDPQVVDVRHSIKTPADRLQWTPDRPSWRKGMPSKARVNLHGTMHTISDDHPAIDTLASCFLKYHPDAAIWKPGSRTSPHLAKWTHFAIESIYYVGGFGDEHYIGQIDLDQYRNEARKFVIQ